MDVGAEEARRLDVVLLRDVVAGLDAGDAVETRVGLLVDEAWAVGVGRHDVFWYALRVDRFSEEGGGG